jgi:hypothetical protein
MKYSVFWDVLPCSPLKVNGYFRGICFPHLQGRGISRVRNQYEECRKQVNTTLILVNRNRNFTHIFPGECCCGRPIEGVWFNTDPRKNQGITSNWATIASFHILGLRISHWPSRKPALHEVINGFFYISHKPCERFRNSILCVIIIIIIGKTAPFEPWPSLEDSIKFFWIKPSRFHFLNFETILFFTEQGR